MNRFCVMVFAGALALSGCSGGKTNASANTASNVQQPPAKASAPTEWRTTPSGLKYRRTQGDGAGPKPGPTDTVTIHYVGRLMDGTEFDSSLRTGEPITMALPTLIRGWQEGVPLMSVGDVYEFQVPPDLGYGPDGGGGGLIPPNATLQFTIGLLGIAP